MGRPTNTDALEDAVTEPVMESNTVWVWVSDEEIEVYVSLAAAAREHGLKDYAVDLHGDGLRSVRLGGYNNTLVECKVTE